MKIKKISYEQIPGKIYVYNDDVNVIKDFYDWLDNNSIPAPKKELFKTSTIRQCEVWYKGLDVYCLYDDNTVRIYHTCKSLPSYCIEPDWWKKHGPLI